MPAKSKAQANRLTSKVKLCEALGVLEVKPRVVLRRTDQQVAVSVVRAIEVDVMHVFTAFHRAPKHALSFLNVNRFRACLSARGGEALGSISIAAYAAALMGETFRDIAAALTSLRRRELQYAAIRADVQRLAELVARKMLPFWLRVPAGLSFLKPGLRSSALQVFAPFGAQRSARTLAAFLRKRRLWATAFTFTIGSRHEGIIPHAQLHA
jgi:hypothetical protein